jgi:4,5-DOPA dioxygenase extradiol
MATIPAAFIGHGSPMNTLESNRYTRAWAEFAASFPKPRAIVAISAHWYINATAVTSMAKPRVIHDFYGFPQELFDFDYDAPGSPDVARQLATLVEPTWVGLDDETWGIDHGTWSVLAHMYPEADVPVVQLSIDASKPLSYHMDLGAKLAPLMDEEILIVSSGNVVHNLGAIAWGAEGQGYEWAHAFDDDARQIMKNNPSDLGDLVDHDAFRMAVPTPDHFLPLAYTAGIASHTGGHVGVFANGCEMGSLSMTSYAVGAPSK